MATVRNVSLVFGLIAVAKEQWYVDAWSLLLRFVDGVHTLCMKYYIVCRRRITNMAAMRNFDVMFDKLRNLHLL